MVNKYMTELIDEMQKKYSDASMKGIAYESSQVFDDLVKLENVNNFIKFYNDECEYDDDLRIVIDELLSLKEKKLITKINPGININYIDRVNATLSCLRTMHDISKEDYNVLVNFFNI